MAYEHKPGSFSLFKNDKRGNDKAPDYKGAGKDMAGNDIQVSAWERSGRSGGTFLSGTIQRKEARTAERPAAAPTDRQRADKAVAAMDDDIPF